MPLKATGRSLLIRILVRLCILARFEDLSAQIRVFVAGETTMTEAFAIQMSWLETKGKTRVIPMSTAHLRATRIADGCITLPPSFRFLPLSLSLTHSQARLSRAVSKAAIHVSSQASSGPGQVSRQVAGEQASRRRQRCCCGRR